MSKTKKTIIASVAILSLLVATAYIFRNQIFRYFFAPTQTFLEPGIALASDARPPNGKISDPISNDIEIVADNLQIPWAITFLPSGDMLVTERPGTLKRIGKQGRVFVIEGVEHAGEGGLLGLALHPRFSENRWLYLYLTTDIGDGLINRVERYRYTDDSLSEKTVIIDNIPGASFHDGGRIAFGPDDYLYITVGDAGKKKLAQDKGSLAGKILRLADDGSVPPDNPFGTAVYSLGHRNPQGLAWDGDGRLWATEHGPFGFDELNLITKGENYGWPVITGDATADGMRAPVAHSGPNETWAPAGMVYLNGSLFFGGLRGETLYQATITGESSVALKSHLRFSFGRIRAVVLGPDGMFYLSTSNTDNHEVLRPGDDKIIRVNPALFKK